MTKPIIAVIPALLLMALATAASSAELLAFRPPDSVTFQVSSRTIRIGEGRTSSPSADTTLTSGDYRIVRGDSGWVLESTVRSMAFHPAGDSLQNILARLLIGLRTLLYINREGKAVRMGGYEALSGRLDSIAPRTMRGVLQQVFSPSNLAAPELNDWNLRLSNLVGRPLEVGRIEHRRLPAAPSSGVPWSLWTVTRFEDTLRVDGRLCLRAGIYTDSDPHRLAAGLGMTAKELRALFDVPDSVPAGGSEGPSYRARVTMVVEVATLLEREEHSEREVILAVPGKDGREAKRRTLETVEKALSYH